MILGLFAGGLPHVANVTKPGKFMHIAGGFLQGGNYKAGTVEPFATQAIRQAGVAGLLNAITGKILMVNCLLV